MSTSVVQHDEARIVAINPHRYRCYGIVDLNKTPTTDNLTADRLAVRRSPLNVRVFVVFVGGNDPYYISTAAQTQT